MAYNSIRMDTQNEARIPKCGNLPNFTGKKVIVGAKQIRKALAAGRVIRAYLAKNADPAITEPIEALCLANQVSYVYVSSMLELGRACGIEVGAATAAEVE